MDDDTTPPEPFCRFYLVPVAEYEEMRADIDDHLGFAKSATGDAGITVVTATSITPADQAPQHEGKVLMPVTQGANVVVRENVDALLDLGDAEEISEAAYRDITLANAGEIE